MSKALVSFLLFLLSYTPHHLFAQKSCEMAVRNVLEQQQVAWNSGNLEAFMHGYWQSDSLQFIGKNGVTYGWRNTFDNYKKSYPDTATMGKLAFTVLHVRVLSKTSVYLTGKWMLTRAKGNVGGYFTLLFRRINGAWVIVSDHTS